MSYYQNKMAKTMKICCLMLFLVNVNAMPTTTPKNTSPLESLIFKTLNWDTEITICNSDFSKLMTFVCNFCENNHCDVKESHPTKTHNEILDLASQCCIDYCRFDTMQLFCGFESFLEEYVNVSTTIGNPVVENIKEIDKPNIFQTILTYLPSSSWQIESIMEYRIKELIFCKSSKIVKLCQMFRTLVIKI